MTGLTWEGESFDWDEAFKYAERPEPCLPQQEINLEPVAELGAFTRECVAEIAGQVVGENDVAPWRIYGRLHDGRWFYLEAGCDYTGWG